MSKPKKYYPIFTKYSNRAKAPQPVAAVAAAAAPPPTTRKRSRSRSWDLAESGPDPKSLKTDIPSSPHCSRPLLPQVDTPPRFGGGSDAAGTGGGASGNDMDMSISPIPMHRERGVAGLALQPSAVHNAPQPTHRRSNSGGGGGNSQKGRSGRIRPKLLLTQSSNKVHHPLVTHRGGNKENKENFLPPWNNALDTTLADEALAGATPNAKAALARLASPKKSFKSSGQRVTDTLRSELGLASPQKCHMKRASRGGSPGLSIASLSRHHANAKAEPSSRGPLPLQDLDSTLVEDDEGIETPLISPRELSQNTRVTANKDDSLRPPREMSVPHSGRALFPPTPQRPLANTDIQASSDSPSESGARPARLFGGKKLPSKPPAMRPTGGNNVTSNKPGGFPPAPRKSRGQQNRFRDANDTSTSRGGPPAPRKAPLRAREATDSSSSSSSSFGFAMPSRSPRRKPMVRALPDTPMMMSPAYGDDSRNAPGTKARPRFGGGAGMLTRTSSSSFDIGAFGKAFSGGAADFGATDSQGSVRPTALCFDSQSDLNSRDSYANRVVSCDVPGTPKVDYSSQSDDMTCSPLPLDSQGGGGSHSRDSFESPETYSQDNFSQRSRRFTASTLRKNKKKSATAALLALEPGGGAAHTPSRLFSPRRPTVATQPPPATPWNGGNLLKSSQLNSRPPPSPFARADSTDDMNDVESNSVPSHSMLPALSRTSSIGSLRISIPPDVPDNDSLSQDYFTPVNQNATIPLLRTTSEQIIIEENRRHRSRRSAGEDTERALADIASRGNPFLPMLLKASTPFGDDEDDMDSGDEDGGALAAASRSSSSGDDHGRPLAGREPPKVARKPNRRVSAGRRGHNGTMLENAAVSVAKFSEAFKPISDLGKGSFGQIKLCRNRVDGCYYAMKMIRRAGLAPLQFNEVFLLSAMQQLPEQCPHIVRYSTAFIEDGMLNIVFEYCAGGGLRPDYLAQFETDAEREKVLKTIADQMLQALDFIHKFGIAHLDVKTANFLRYDEERHDLFKLCDFGLATDLDDARTTGHAEDGDGRYVAPELFMNRAFDLRKCDVYSLGCALLEMASQEKLGSRGDDAYLPHVLATSAKPKEEVGALSSAVGGFSEKFLAWLKTLLVEDPTKRTSVTSALVSLHMLDSNDLYVDADVDSPTPSRQVPGDVSPFPFPPTGVSIPAANNDVDACTTPSISSRRTPSTLPVLDDSPSQLTTRLSSLTIHSQNSRVGGFLPERAPLAAEAGGEGDAKDRELRHLAAASEAKDREILLLREQMRRMQKELAWHREAKEGEDKVATEGEE